MWLFVAIELAVAIARIPFLKVTAGLRVRNYMKHVILPLLPLALTACLSSFICITLFHFPLRFFVTIAVSVVCSLTALWTFTLSHNERLYITQSIKNRLRHDP